MKCGPDQFYTSTQLTTYQCAYTAEDSHVEHCTHACLLLIAHPRAVRVSQVWRRPQWYNQLAGDQSVTSFWLSV